MLLDTPYCNFGWNAPDFFGLSQDGYLQYRGRLDDAGMNYHGKRTP